MTTVLGVLIGVIGALGGLIGWVWWQWYGRPAYVWAKYRRAYAKERGFRG